MTWVNSCLSTRAQLYGFFEFFGLDIATTRPVQAPTVGMNGRATVRPLNHSWSFITSIWVEVGSV